jgi:hypothetical protein
MRKRLCGALGATAAVLAISAVVLAVSACSSGATSNFVATGGASVSSAPVPSSTPTHVAGLVSFPFPASVHVEFQTALPPSGAQQGAMIGYENYVDSMWYAVDTLGQSDTYKKYISGNALTFAKELIAEFKVGGYALRGTVVYYDTTVPSVYYGKGAVVESCVNVSGLQMVNPGTGQSAGNILNSKYDFSQEQASAGEQRDGAWWIVQTQFSPASSGGSAGMCAS